jgi:hypothetical protein
MDEKRKRLILNDKALVHLFICVGNEQMNKVGTGVETGVHSNPSDFSFLQTLRSP